VLVVDDAHLLDDESAELLWRFAGGGGVHVVATVRAGERAPDRVTRLWADGARSRLDLAPLAKGDVRALLELVLDGDVAGASSSVSRLTPAICSKRRARRAPSVTRPRSAWRGLRWPRAARSTR
jgi:hypothetical protein